MPIVEQKPLLVGELNPYGSADRYALFPYPKRAAGNKLRVILGLCDRDYMQRFDRANLCTGKWKKEDAVAKMKTLLEKYDRVVLLGVKVSEVFATACGEARKLEAFTHDKLYFAGASGESWLVTYVYLPHPSGLNRLWNVPGAHERARELLRQAGILQASTG